MEYCTLKQFIIKRFFKLRSVESIQFTEGDFNISFIMVKHLTSVSGSVRSVLDCNINNNLND